MKGPLAFAVVAAMVMYASATPCTDMCSGECGASKAACEIFGIFGGLCNTNFNLCSMGCGAICNCVDTCNTQCNGELAKCQEGADLLGAATCPVQYADCQAMCGFQCAVGTASSAIDGLMGGGAP